MMETGGEGDESRTGSDGDEEWRMKAGLGVMKMGDKRGVAMGRWL